MKIIRGKVNSNSADDKYHRVKVTSEGVLKNLLVDNVNGIYLRSGEEVYIAIKDDYTEPMVIGRCSGQLEIQDLVDVINGLIDVINGNNSKFNSHTHTITHELGVIIPPATAPIPVEGVITETAPPSSMKNLDKVKVDDILY